MRNKLWVFSSVVVLLTACASRIDTDVKRTYETKTQLPVNAASVLVRYDFNPTLKAKGADHLFSRGLTQELEKWVHTRLRPAGQYGTAFVTVRDASVVEIPTYANPEKFEGRLDAVISLVDQRGVTIAQAETKVRREKEAPGGISETERAELTRVVSIDTVNAFDRQMEEAIMRMTSSVPPYTSVR